MKDPFLTYSLTFTHKKGRKKPPELVFVLRAGVLDKVEEMLRTSRITEVAGIKEYLKKQVPISWQEPELSFDSSKRAFGIGGCGYAVSVDGVQELRFPYEEETLFYTAKTIQLLLVALNWCGELEEFASNRSQLCAVDTRCELADAGWGHAMVGRLHPTLRNWFAELDEAQREELTKNAVEAMRVGWLAFVEPSKRKEYRHLYRHDFICTVRYQGRFLLQCPGNACDIAIYPEEDYWPDADMHSSFGCHNLDSAQQQLALLAGLATLCEFAGNDMEKT